ncbi:bifunctional UDP-sugar hydrolase/5'-nucleotidase [Mitsuokella sp. AF21-1AC]|uniref:bifunctional metallophosphatase/5'-nucleotidase n=1 Tax=Mitsuokella sp. AF21-1AC TaxID=2292235 RepID=UPI000E541D87|nr:5'-nucleotidase C-terminal domain-containing protein [Mitsuokella sp. AF21-1AC]RGS74145.1 hypothetical protein DWX75_02325 [Mitsuokella sp. AF21-1AC]
MKTKRSLKVMVLAALTAALSAGTAFAGDLTVFSTSDVHGSVIGWNYFKAQSADVGLAKISTIINEARAQKGKDDAILCIDGGDILQGTPLDTYMVQHPDEWKAGQHPMFVAFNQIGYDAIELGNHEFNFGLDYLKKAIGKNKNVLGANVIDDKTGKTWSGVRPYLIKTVKIDGENVKVGIVGTDTPAIPNFEAPAHFAGVRFEDQVPVMQKYVKELKDKGADIIIGVTHSGVPRGDRNSVENQVVAIAEACPDLDLLICAHNHVVIDNKSGVKGPDGTVYADAVINGVPVVESGKDGKFVGKSNLTIHKVDGKWKVEKVTTQAISVKGVKDDPAIVKQVKPWHEKTLQSLQQIIGEATDTFAGAESNHQDSAIVDFVNDVQRHYAGTQLSASASLNTSQDIDKGPITLQEISGLYIYENYLFGIEINGAELRKYMEHAASFYGTSPDYNYDMVQGIDYTIDLNQPVGHRITKLQYQGRDVKDSDTFTMAINDYRMNGGSGYMAAMGYTDGRKPKVVFDSMKLYGDDGQVRSLITRYIQEKGTITPAVDHNWNVIPKK